MYVPSRRRCSLRVRTITALTTLPFCTWPSGAASFTAAVITSPSPAFNPVEPPSGRIICSLRAPELSATSSIDLIITAMASISPYLSPVFFRRASATCRRAQSRLPEPAPSCAQFPSASSVSAWTAAAFPRSGPRRQHALRSSHRGRKTSYCAPPRAGRTGATSYASPSPRWSCACGWRRLLPPLPCGAPAPAQQPMLIWTNALLRIPALSFLRRGGALALTQDCLDARNILAQAANFLQALRLPHVELKLQLEELVGELALLVVQLDVS